MTAWHERFSPTWWAAWTFALARPGRLDDEEVPAALADAARGVWTHYPPWLDAHGHHVGALDARPARRDHARRQDWPTMEWTQRRDAPAETDDCRLHDGRCSGACEMEADRWA